MIYRILGAVLLLTAALWLPPAPVQAQSQAITLCSVVGSSPTYTAGTTRPCTVNTSGELITTGSGGGGGGDVNLTQVGGVNVTLGQKTMSASIPMVIASDQSAIAVTAAQLTDGTQKTQIVDSGGTSATFTGTNLNVQCANCSGSGASATDEDAFAAGGSVFAPSGGVFQTTATDNPLATGEQGLVQMTANRAFHTNLRSAAGVEVGTAGAPLQVSLANTGSNASALLVTGTGGTFPATQSGTWNINDISGTISLPTGAATAANQQTDALTDTELRATPVPISGTVTVTDGSGALNVILDSGTLTSITNAVTVAQPTAANLNATVVGTGTFATQVTTFPDNEPFNVAQINGVAPSMGNGASGTGVQRVTIANDSTGILAAVTNVATIGTSVTPGTSAAHLGKAEDATANSGDTGVSSLWVRADTAAATGANGDYVWPISNSVGQLHVTGTGVSASALPPQLTALGVAGDGGLAAGTAALNPLFGCTDSVNYDASTSGNTELVALTSSETIYVCGYIIRTGATATDVRLVYGTGTACATGETSMTPIYNMTSYDGQVVMSPFYTGLKAAVSNALCIETSAGNPVDAQVFYTKF